MSIESKEILDLHSIYQNIQELSVGTITTKCKDGKKRIDCTAADKAWLEAQKGDSDSTVKTNNITSGKGTVCKDGKNVFDGSPCGEKDSNEKVDGNENKNGNGNGNETNVKVDKVEVKKVKCKDGSMAADCTAADAAWEKKQKENGNGNEIKKENGNGNENKEIKVDKRSDAEKKIDSLGKMSNLERKNRLRFGNEKIDHLKQKQIDFKTMQANSQLPGADRGKEKLKFINKYPNSITAQKYHGLRDHLEWDAFDMVGSYLMDSKQVESMDEALYVMMEMDSNTIQNIVKESEFELIEARRADKKGIKRGEKGNPDTDQAPSGQQAADTKTGYKARRVERREGDKRRKANKERKGWNYGGKEAAAGDLANAQRQPDADLGSQKQVTDTGAHKDKHGWRQRVSSPASGRKSEGAMSDREDKRYPPQNPKHKLHGKKTKKDKPQGRYKEVKENYAAVEAIRLLIEKQNKSSGNQMADNAPNKSPKNDGTIESEINQIQTMPALPDKDVKKFLDAGETKNAPSKESKPTNKNNGTKKPNRTNVGGRWYNNNLDGANDLKSNKDIA